MILLYIKHQADEMQQHEIFLRMLAYMGEEDREGAGSYRGGAGSWRGWRPGGRSRAARAGIPRTQSGTPSNAEGEEDSHGEGSAKALRAKHWLSSVSAPDPASPSNVSVSLYPGRRRMSMQQMKLGLSEGKGSYCRFEGNETEQDLSEKQIIALLTNDWRQTPGAQEGIEPATWAAKVTISGMKAWTAQQLGECSRCKLLGLLRESARLLTAGGVLAVPAVKWDPHSVNEAESQAARRVGFLLLTYRPQYWYWELIELSRKVVTVCLTVFVWRRSVRNVALVLGVTILALLATLRLQPHRSRSVNNTQIFSLFVQCVTLMYALMMRAIEDTEGALSESEGRAAYAVLAALFCMVP
eukprot:1138174-Rhodomonas_salina.1